MGIVYIKSTDGSTGAVDLERRKKATGSQVRDWLDRFMVEISLYLSVNPRRGNRDGVLLRGWATTARNSGRQLHIDRR